MTIENTIASLLAESKKLQEANEVVPTKGTPEPSNAKNNVDDEQEAKGGTSKKANRATQGALPAETMAKLQAEAYDDLTEDEIEMLESIDEEAFEQLDELSKKTLGSYVKKAAAQRVTLTNKSRDLEDNDRALVGFKHNGDEAGEHVRAARSAIAKQQRKVDDKAMNRGMGISSAVKRLTKEDVEALFNGEDGLTEEFRQKAETIFEAAVTSRIKEEVARIEESYEQRLEEALEEQIEGLVEHVDGYLNLMVKQWMEDNAVALESGMKADILESFVGGLKGLFQEHYIDVPEEKFDLVGEMEAKIEDLKSKLDEAVALNVELNEVLSDKVRAEIVAEACEGLSDVQAERLMALSEEISFESTDSFANKLQTIRENYFMKKPASNTPSAFLVEETILEEKSVPAEMQAYVKTISTLTR